MAVFTRHQPHVDREVTMGWSDIARTLRELRAHADRIEPKARLRVREALETAREAMQPHMVGRW